MGQVAGSGCEGSDVDGVTYGRKEAESVVMMRRR